MKKSKKKIPVDCVHNASTKKQNSNASNAYGSSTDLKTYYITGNGAFVAVTPKTIRVTKNKRYVTTVQASNKEEALDIAKKAYSEWASILGVICAS